MFYLKMTIFLYIFQLSLCNWVSEWMNPVREQFIENPVQRNNDNNNYEDIMVGDENLRIAQATESPDVVKSKNSIPTTTIQMKLKSTIQSAKILAESLEMQINELSRRETNLKDAIVNGRSGVSAVTVTSMERPAQVYLVRDGYWTQCTGVVQLPTQNGNLFNEFSSTPKCIGKEITSRQDPCVFNSLIKYETVPTIRRLEYTEDEFLCLKKTFNSTLERYLSVPRQVINDTCRNGIVRSLEDNIAKCGVRVMSEYTYYPTRGYAVSSSLPLEYCSEQDGSCKLLVAWHVSNASVENFELLKDVEGFKKFFIKPGNYIEHII